MTSASPSLPQFCPAPDILDDLELLRVGAFAPQHDVRPDGALEVPNEAELADNNPYNTRVNPGLPIGPISNPGKASILASAHPAEGDWFFFVTVDPETGETKFAKTFAEHQQNEAQFLTWCTDHPGVCK